MYDNKNRKYKIYFFFWLFEVCAGFDAVKYRTLIYFFY